MLFWRRIIIMPRRLSGFGNARKKPALRKRIVLEIHNQSLVETTDSALRLLDLIGDDQVGLIHDAGNMYITDTEFGEESVRHLGSRLFHVHIKDERRIGQGATRERLRI